MAQDILEKADYEELEREFDPYPAIPSEEILSSQTKEKSYFLHPIIFDSSRALIYASTGIGKTFLSWGLVVAISSGGSFGPWRAREKRKVLYIDGEMGERRTKERLIQTAKFSCVDLETSNIRIITCDRCKEQLPPNIADPKVQSQLESATDWADAIIFDNWCSLSRPFLKKQDDRDLWSLFHTWNIKLTAKGKATVMIHHAGKSGSYLGTSLMTQSMDVVLRLQRPEDYKMRDGAKFEIHFEKGRDLIGDDVEPLLAKFSADENGVFWDFKKVSDVLPARVLELRRLGLKDREIARELNLPYSQVLAVRDDVQYFNEVSEDEFF